MNRAMIAGSAYFIALFVLGFALGTIRMLFVAPRIGELAATLAEVPVMLAAALFVSRAAIRHWRVPPGRAIRWVMVLWFLALLVLFETLLGAALFGRSLAEQWSAVASPAGMLGFSAQTIAALLPLIVGND